MPPKNESRMLGCCSMLALPFNIFLSGTALSFLTILTLAAAYLGKPTAGSGLKTAVRVPRRVATRKGWQLIVMIPKD